ncbi:hypothetical protein [Mycolicibacterium thermoresistibile]|uniref:Uncharacterized protein n=2 Tax=Mycolicibacterium thermoresistibile TaxID=1797 RepID=G7CB91_MYCT3|nr:hypothetical protein [Mycolicibacterium thermoresistibile]EHI14764.1 hypothetical protein KEK_01165 [Mycolicibacterium thermoresistibile ATCC 19527]GAT16052.1 putative uncharacterized protein [Mycolicibacterium thermoresistibile]SNW18697.1 Uncharacterised protein [Mycolicibacterium thermoresistibile]
MTGPTELFSTATLTTADREWIAAQVATAPRFTTDQRDRLAELLRPVRQGIAG